MTFGLSSFHFPFLRITLCKTLSKQQQQTRDDERHQNYRGIYNSLLFSVFFFGSLSLSLSLSLQSDKLWDLFGRLSNKKYHNSLPFWQTFMYLRITMYANLYQEPYMLNDYQYPGSLFIKYIITYLYFIWITISSHSSNISKRI